MLYFLYLTALVLNKMRKSNLLYLCVVCSILVKANVALTAAGFTATIGNEANIEPFKTIILESVTSNVGGLYMFHVEIVVGPDQLAVPAALQINQDNEPGTDLVVRGNVLADNSKVDQFSTGGKTVVLTLGAHDKFGWKISSQST